MNKPIPFNPLDKKNLGVSVADELLAQELEPLPPEPFIGAGIYAIYYKGNYQPYKKISLATNKSKTTVPIYVGKAVPEGARKGGFGLDADPGKVLFKRLREHAASIEQVKNLKISDFLCAYLVVEDIWIPLGESLLISKFKPLWNFVVDGFGNHTPGEGRFKQERSKWDVLHPGREWAERCAPSSVTTEEILNNISIALK